MNKDNVTSSVEFEHHTRDSSRNATNGIITYSKFQGYEVPQFRCLPENAQKLMEANGFNPICMRNIGMKNSSTHINSIRVDIATQFLYVGYLSKD